MGYQSTAVAVLRQARADEFPQPNGDDRRAERSSEHVTGPRPWYPSHDGNALRCLTRWPHVGAAGSEREVTV